MKTLIALLLSTSAVFAVERELEDPYLSADSVVVDNSIDSDETVMYFYFPQSMLVSNAVLRYNIDGGEEKLFNPSPEKPLEIKTSAGTHRFLFYYTLGNYAEEFAMAVGEGGQRTYFTVYFREATIIDIVEKPVIYLYPEQTQNVSVNVAAKGDLLFTYPAYNDGWNVTAHPNGQLELDSMSYNYLFWEAEQPQTVVPSYMMNIAGADVSAALENILTEAGMNGRERADFITYWVPRMQQHDYVNFGFVLHEECDAFAQLEITPQPDHVYRIYMIWQPSEHPSEMPERHPYIPKMDRSGFTVLEWGGLELSFTKQNFDVRETARITVH